MINYAIKIWNTKTGEVRQGGERVGFEVVTIDGRTAPLASINNTWLVFITRSSVLLGHLDTA